MDQSELSNKRIKTGENEEQRPEVDLQAQVLKGFRANFHKSRQRE